MSESQLPLTVALSAVLTAAIGGVDRPGFLERIGSSQAGRAAAAASRTAADTSPDVQAPATVLRLKPRRPLDDELPPAA